MDPNSADFGSLTSFILQLNKAIRERNGQRLECILSLTNRAKNPSLFRLSNADLLDASKSHQLTRDEQEIRASVEPSWVDATLEFWRTAHYIKRNTDALLAFTHCAAMVQHVIKGFNTWEAWALPALFSACRDIRILATRADTFAGSTQAGSSSLPQPPQQEQQQNLEEAARLINKAFTICITDREEMTTSRKWGTYCIIGILFRTYFALNKLSLTKNVLRAVSVSDLPALDFFPKAHVVTWRYYLGVIAFMQEDYDAALTHLQGALRQSRAGGNRDLILYHLVPTHLMTTRMLPSAELLRRFPALGAVYTPLVVALRSGNVAAYDRALLKGEVEFIRRRVYLTLERARDLCIRSLFRKIWLLGDKGTRIPISKFASGLNMGVPRDSDAWIDQDEAECFVANMIYKKFVKGYISRERAMVVLSANDPFPKLCK